jgi:hypothetical protein
MRREITRKTTHAKQTQQLIETNSTCKMNTSKSKAQLSSIVGTNGKSSQKASAGSSPVVVTPHKMKFDGTVNPIDYASSISVGAELALGSNRKPSHASIVTVTVPSACDGVKKVRKPTNLLGQASVSKAEIGSTVSGHTQKTSCSLKSKLASKSNVAVKDIKPDDTSGAG